MNILFVCLGNICRSPSAHGILEKMVAQKQLSDKIHVDSAGTASYHTGEPPDIRSQEHAQKRGYQLNSRARQFTIEDFTNFDWIIAMDDSNYKNILSMVPDSKYEEKVRKFMTFCPDYQSSFSEVPDPYYDGDRGFETVLDILEEGCHNLFEKLQTYL